MPKKKLSEALSHQFTWVNTNATSLLYMAPVYVLRCRDNVTVSVLCIHDTMWSVETVFFKNQRNFPRCFFGRIVAVGLSDVLGNL